MAVRTKLLAEGVMGTSATVVYTCPAGKTAIVKQIAYFNPTAGATTTVFIAQVIGGASRGWLRDIGLPAGSANGYSSGFFVLEPGQTITVQANPSSAVQFTISGAELDGVA